MGGRPWTSREAGLRDVLLDLGLTGGDALGVLLSEEEGEEA